MILVPESWGSTPATALLEFNACHDPKTGRFCSKGTTGAKYTQPKRDERGVTKVRTVDEAVEYILAGKDVELFSTRSVNTVIRRLADMAQEAERLGRDAPNYDLCKVSVKGTNVFCVDKFRSQQYPEGVPRVEMPQMSGMPVPGSEADRLPKNSNGEVNAAQAFIKHLRSQGIKVTRKQVPAAYMKASQAELVGPKVAGMMTSKTYNPAKEPIFMSRDAYVVDGHHRWASIVGRDARDGRLGSHKMTTFEVDAPISFILREANDWAAAFGIAPKAAGKGAKVR